MQNIIFETTITGVSPLGQLQTIDSLEHSFDFDEIEWNSGFNCYGAFFTLLLQLQNVHIAETALYGTFRVLPIFHFAKDLAGGVMQMNCFTNNNSHIYV